MRARFDDVRVPDTHKKEKHHRRGAFLVHTAKRYIANSEMKAEVLKNKLIRREYKPEWQTRTGIG